MKYLLLILTMALCLSIAPGIAQNPYQTQGVETDPLTLSNGTYQEFFTNDTLVQIGSVIFNTNTREVIRYLEPDSLNIALPEPGTSSRFLSIDPLAAKYPSMSPYNYAINNPISFLDPDGKAATGCCYGQSIAWSNQKAHERGGSQAVYENTQRRGKESVGFLVGVATVASAFIPGPEDVAIGALAATKAWKAVKGVFRASDEVVGVADEIIDSASPSSFLRTESLSGKSSSKKVDDLVSSMKNNGWEGDPISVVEINGEKYILDGHHRVAAARKADINVKYKTVKEEDLSKFGYSSKDEVISAHSESRPNKLK